MSDLPPEREEEILAALGEKAWQDATEPEEMPPVVDDVEGIPISRSQIADAHARGERVFRNCTTGLFYRFPPKEEEEEEEE